MPALRVGTDRSWRKLFLVVENTTGAAGTIGVGRVARAAPDGYTISIGHWGTHVVNGAIYELPYHVLNDFEPVSLIATNPQLIVSRKAVPAMDLKELIGWLKANAATATQGTAGHGDRKSTRLNSSHLKLSRMPSSA